MQTYFTTVSVISEEIIIKRLATLFIALDYCNMYVLEPGETKTVQAGLSDPYGLKIGIVYDAAPEGQYLLYQRWQVTNESVLTITYVNGGDISTFGGIIFYVQFFRNEFKIFHFYYIRDGTVSMGKDKIKESDGSAFARAIEALTYQSPVTRAAIRK